MLKVVVVAVLGTAFWAALFILFNQSFQFLNVHAYIFRDQLVKHILSLFFLTLTVMLVFSNALISFSNLFRSPETTFLFSLPIRHDTIYLYKMIESLVFSSWALFALGLPLLIAYGMQSDVSWFYYPVMVVFLIPFVIIPAAMGALIGLVLTAIVPRHRGKMLAVLACVAAAGAAYLAVDVLKLQSGLASIGAGEMKADVQMILGRLQFTQHPMLPNYWITHGLLAVARDASIGMRDQDFRDAGLFFAALCTSALFFVSLGWFAAGAIYETSFSKSHAAGRGRRVKRRGLIEALAQPFQRRYPAVTVMVIKDVKTFLRDPVQWSQVLIFFGLLTVYISNLRNFAYPIDRPFYHSLISFLNLGATCLTLATMVSRFVFPLISLEGQRFWVLGLVPVERRRILVAKFIFSLGGALVITLSLVCLSNYILKSGGFILFLQLATSAMLCVGLTGLAVGMGAIFPSLHEQNPSKIVSGFGGTLTLILSISMVLLIIVAEAIVCNKYLDAALESNEDAQLFRMYLVGMLFVVCCLTSLAAYIPLSIGAKALDEMEF
ncbi:MAG: hypothetical protein KIS92_21840 [Planctomycetota bacterium]|nr:hypothetical protein [Planctomycetota bacterium]